jgi:DnaK suppressor protein
MTQTSSANHELNRFRAILEVRIAELECRIRYRDGITVEQSPDQVEEIQRASERALAICNIDRESKQLRDTRAALRRIREGSFGVCEQCEEQIHPKRLLAIPWASLCIRCQQATDCGGELKRTGTVQPYEKEFFRKHGGRVPALIGGALFKESGGEGALRSFSI